MSLLNQNGVYFTPEVGGSSVWQISKKYFAGVIYSQKSLKCWLCSLKRFPHKFTTVSYIFVRAQQSRKSDMGWLEVPSIILDSMLSIITQLSRATNLHTICFQRPMLILSKFHALFVQKEKCQHNGRSLGNVRQQWKGKKKWA